MKNIKQKMPLLLILFFAQGGVYAETSVEETMLFITAKIKACNESQNNTFTKSSVIGILGDDIKVSTTTVTSINISFCVSPV